MTRSMAAAAAQPVRTAIPISTVRCPRRRSPSAKCLPGCGADSDCPANFDCDPRGSCRPICGDGHICLGVDLICDHGNVAGQNHFLNGDAWCYACLAGSDCARTEGCNRQSCGPCADSSQCASDRVCVSGLCQPRCDASRCPGGEVCDSLDVADFGTDVCLRCVTAADCSGGLGCNRATHSCGTCLGPRETVGAGGETLDCPPGDVCSSYWEGGQTGVCLASCDLRPCPASQPRCEVIPSLNTDHRYCVGCLHDADCADAGPGAWCDVSVNLTTSCQPAPI